MADEQVEGGAPRNPFEDGFEVPDEVREAFAQEVQVTLTIGQVMAVSSAAATFLIGDAVSAGQADEMSALIQVGLMSAIIETVGGSQAVQQAIATLRDAVPEQSLRAGDDDGGEEVTPA